jgi:hypothetical protein
MSNITFTKIWVEKTPPPVSNRVYLGDVSVYSDPVVAAESKCSCLQSGCKLTENIAPVTLISLQHQDNPNTERTDMQKGATTQPLGAEIFSDCRRIKAGIMLNWGNHQLEFYE